MSAPTMDIANLRIALFSGNYNMTTDGANKALNRTVDNRADAAANVRLGQPFAVDVKVVVASTCYSSRCRQP